jgi:arylsulfate sulfotransferase
VLFTLLLGLAALFIFVPTAPSAKATKFIQKAIANQVKIEKEIEEYYQAGDYTFQQPLVIQDPYQQAPLTALVIFDTPEASQISIHVPGNDSQADVDFTFPGYVKHHEIPIYGLYANTLNHVMLTMQTQGGESTKNVIDLQTEPLPVNLPKFAVTKKDPALYSPGFNFTAQDKKQIFDIDGATRWYSKHTSFQVFTPLKNGHFLFTYIPSSQTDTIVMEQDLLGKIYAVYNIVDGIHHDIYELPNGNLLITSNDMRSSTIYDYLLEVDRSSGRMVRSFDLKDILDTKRPPEFDLGSGDWLHLNSVIYDASDQTIIISSKAQSAVIKMAYPSMQIKWILGPHDNWGTQYQPYLLTPIGENFEWQWGQHNATLYDATPSSPSQVDLLLFDNGIYRSFTQAGAYSPSESYSMMVHYRIDESARTVEEVWEYGKENGSATFSCIRSGANLLANGDILGDWGAITKNADGNLTTYTSLSGEVDTRIIEVNPSTNQVVFDASALKAVTYRAFRADLYNKESPQNAYLTIQVNDTTRHDLYNRGVLVLRGFHRWFYSLKILWYKGVHHLGQMIG